METRIKLCVDSIVRNGQTGELLITGWAIDEQKKGNVKIVSAVSETSDITISQFYRLDIAILYQTSTEILAGFEVRILPQSKHGKVVLSFESEEDKLPLTIKLNKYYPLVPGTETPIQLKLSKVRKGLGYLKRNGLRSTIKRFQLDRIIGNNEYLAWIMHNEQWNEEACRKEIKKFSTTPLISILVPVYNVDLQWLSRCVQSVQEQWYENWELCLSDDASTNPEVQQALNAFAKQDERIKVVIRQENGHISAATNSALEIATGEFIALLDNDDELAPAALYEVVKKINEFPDLDLVYSDEDKINQANHRMEPAFKPDWSPDLLLGTNYISHLGVYRRSIAEEINGFRIGFEGAQDYDFVLRFTEKTSAQRIYHIPKVLYHWRMLPESTAASASGKDYANEAGLKALEDTLKRRELPGKVVYGPAAGFYTVNYDVRKEELVSIIIPTRDGYEDLKQCVDSIIEKTTYPNYEIIIADNGSVDPQMKELYASYKEQLQSRFIVEEINIPFNYSRINNLATKKANGKYLLFLNNDTKVIEPMWMTRMVAYGQFAHIGCVGAKLYYPDNTIQHAGVILGLGNVAGHGHHYFPDGDLGYFGRLYLNVDYLAVTAACVLVKKADFDQVNGFDETFEVAFNDVDLCLRIYELGRYNVWVHNAELYHYESKSRGYETTPEKIVRFNAEKERLQARWQKYIDHDPFYSPNLTRGTGNFTIRVEELTSN